MRINTLTRKQSLFTIVYIVYIFKFSLKNVGFFIVYIVYAGAKKIWKILKIPDFGKIRGVFILSPPNFLTSL